MCGVDLGTRHDPTVAVVAHALRDLSFRIPDWTVPHRRLLEAGFAIDGNEATCAVTSWTDEHTGQYHPLSEELRRKQVELVEWFNSHGYNVTFA